MADSAAKRERVGRPIRGGTARYDAGRVRPLCGGGNSPVRPVDSWGHLSPVQTVPARRHHRGVDSVHVAQVGNQGGASGVIRVSVPATQGVEVADALRTQEPSRTSVQQAAWLQDGRRMQAPVGRQTGRVPLVDAAGGMQVDIGGRNGKTI